MLHKGRLCNTPKNPSGKSLSQARRKPLELIIIIIEN